MRTLHALALISTAAIAASGFTSASGSDEKEIHALYAKLAQGLKSKNVKMVESTEAPGFTQEDMGRKMNAKDASEMMKQEFKQIQKIDSFNIKVTSLKVNGKTATGTSSYAMKFSGLGPDKKTHKFVITGSSNDDLVKTAKGWLFLSDKETPGKMMMDGKPMKMPGG